MSMNPLANPKTALAAAGGVVIVALLASVGLNGFAPADNAAPASVEVVGTTPKPSQPEQAATWDDAGSADDWGTDDEASDAASDWGGSAAEPSNSSAPSFGDYNPEVGEDMAPSQAAEAPRRHSRSGNSGTITSGAAPDAPDIAPPPGGGGSL